MPKVSVIIPVYGVEKYIERCARSLFEQTLDDIEYLFIDDCTPDGSIEILKKVLDRYPHRKKQVLIHRMECNSGQAKVREWGMKHVTGEYVIHCDSDDWVEKEMLEALYDKAILNDADVVVCDYKIHNGQQWYIKRGCGVCDLDKYQKDILHEIYCWNLWNKMFRRKIINKIEFYPENNMGEDLVMTMQMIYYCTKMAYVPHAYYYYYFNPGSIVRQKTANGIISNYMQYSANCNLLVDFYARHNCIEKYQNGLNWIKYTVRRTLFVNDDKIRSVRKKVFPFIELQLLLTHGIQMNKKKELIKVLIDQIFLRV